MKLPAIDVSLEEVQAACVPIRLPMRYEFRGVRQREGILIKGPSGWGEFSPFEEYNDTIAARWLACALEAAFGEWPSPVRTSVPVNAIVPALDSASAGALAREAIWQLGCHTIKVKVGGDLPDDEARVVAVRDALDASQVDGRIRLDANGSWSVAEAERALARLSQYGIEFVEQPCRTLEDIAKVRQSSDVPVAVDEGVRLAADPLSISLSGIADIAVIKPMSLGGVAVSLKVAAAVGVPVVVSSSMGSAVGLSACVALAGALPDLPFASGLGTGALLAEDVSDPPLVPRNGAMDVVRTAPDLKAMMRASTAMEQERASWWMSRLSAAFLAYQGLIHDDDLGLEQR